MDKTRYSAFAGTPLELMLRERNIKEIHIIGVCTDICVLHSIIKASKLLSTKRQLQALISKAMTGLYGISAIPWVHMFYKFFLPNVLNLPNTVISKV